MASRPELVRIAKELGIDTYGLTSKDMEEQIVEKFTNLYNNVPVIGDQDVSDELLKYILTEFHCYLRDKNGNVYTLKNDKIVKKES